MLSNMRNWQSLINKSFDIHVILHIVLMWDMNQKRKYLFDLFRECKILVCTRGLSIY